MLKVLQYIWVGTFKKNQNSQLHVEYNFLLSFQPNASLVTSDSQNAPKTPQMSGVEESPRPQSESYVSGAPTTPQAITSSRPQSQSYASGAPTTPQVIMSPRPQSESYVSGAPTTPQVIMSPRTVASDT